MRKTPPLIRSRLSVVLDHMPMLVEKFGIWPAYGILLAIIVTPGASLLGLGLYKLLH